MGTSVKTGVPIYFYMKTLIQLLLIFCVLVVSVNAKPVLHGKVIKVTDGDTIVLLVGKTSHRIRLSSIDAPERSQAYGKASRMALGEFLRGKTVTVLVNGKDRYRRLLGTVFADDENVNEWMLRNGWAWHYKKYDKSEVLAKLESQARFEKLGLWKGDDPVAPWKFRK